MPTLFELRNHRSNVRQCNIYRCHKYFRYSSSGMHYCGNCRNKVNEARKELQQTKFWSVMLYLAGGVCPSCHKDCNRLTIDHIRSLTHAWDWRWRNIQPLCPQCNTRKGKHRVDYRPRWWVGTLEDMEKEGLL